MDTIYKVSHSRVKDCKSIARAGLKSGEIDEAEDDAEKALVLNGMKYVDVMNRWPCYWLKIIRPWTVNTVRVAEDDITWVVPKNKLLLCQSGVVTYCSRGVTWLQWLR